MKLTFVTPRYGADIVGGAEFAVRMLAEKCVQYGGVQAEVLTTTSGDERTWSKKYAEGTEEINGVSVTRFDNAEINRQEFDSWASQLLQRPEQVDSQKFDEWLIRQGPYSDELLVAIEQTTSDAVIFHPMLSSPTSHGLLRATAPTVLHPALHDEPLARMPGYGNVMRNATLLAFSTRFEQQLATNIHGAFINRQSVIGFGVEPPATHTDEDVKHTLESFYLLDTPYVVVLGRVDAGKGADMCARLWESAQDFVSPGTKLAFVGPVSPTSELAQLSKDDLARKNVVLTGALPDKEKDIVVSNARCLVSPSVTESFSLVLLEAMAAGVPVVVNRYCGPTHEHIMRAQAGASFEDFAGFIAAINSATTESSLRDTWIARGKNYVLENYSWKNVVSNYLEVIENL